MNVMVRLLHAATKRHNWRVHPGYTFHGTAYTAFQVCAGCGTFQPIVLPPGHPESLVEELTREEEDLLGAIADELWPEVADREMADAVRHNVFGDDGSDLQ